MINSVMALLYFHHHPSRVHGMPHAYLHAGKMNAFWKNNSLSISFAALTLLSLLGHAWAGYWADEQERFLHHFPVTNFLGYLGSGAFASSLFENWESEFLQMALFVVLTVGLRQRGSSESKPLDDEPQRTRPRDRAPWPVRRGGAWKKVYEHSLSLALFSLFLVSFVGHWCGSYAAYVADQQRHGQRIAHSVWRHLNESQFWFESFQNWQSEFFSITALVLLSIFLREKNSAQSKDVFAPHRETGS